MAAHTPALLTLEEFLSEYGGEIGYEYWFGEVVYKGIVTWKHSLLARVLEDLFQEHGYKAATEVDLAVDPNWRPRPDVLAAIAVEHPYPTKPVPVVAEILSPDDRMSRVFKKCRHYVRIGIPQILVFDPETRDAWEWSRETDNLERIQAMTLPNNRAIPMTLVWDRLDARLAE